MNNSTAVFLINDNVRAVYGTYEAGDNAGKTIFKTFDQALKVGDFAIVPTNTRHNMTVVKITDVDVEFDIDTPMKIDWIIGTIDLTAYGQVLAQENAAIQMIQSAESEYVNNHPYCLHLWRNKNITFPMSPSILVGVKSAGILTPATAAKFRAKLDEGWA